MAITRWLMTLALTIAAGAAALPANAQAPQARADAAESAHTTTSAATGVVQPAGYVIGPDDVLSIVYWRDKDMSADVTVRPDGKITLPLLSEVQAAGLTPADLRSRLAAESKRYFENPNVTVVVKQINSRKVFITGQIAKPGSYALTAPTTVLQLISMSGGLKDYADSKNIMIVRYENGRRFSYAFNYKEIGRNLQQDIELKPGDTVVVP